MLAHFLKTSGSLTTDIIVLVVLFFIFFFYAFYFGKSRVISSILAFYPAVYFFQHFPFISQLMVLQGTYLVVVNKILIFLLFFIPLDIMIGRYVFSDSGYGGSRHIIRIAGFALSAVVLVLIFTHSIISLDVFYKFSPAINTYFTTSTQLFWWSIGSVGLLFFL